MAYNPSIHTASNKPYGVTGMPVDARYWYYDSDLFEYRAYASTAEVLAYLIGDDRKGATVQVGTVEYWFRDGIADSDLVQKAEIFNQPIIYNIPSGQQTPIIINFANDTIKIGSASPVSIGADLAPYRANPQVLFEIITSTNNTTPKEPSAWISNKEWSDDTYTSLVEVTLQPDTDTGLEGGLTLDNINIIIKA